MFRITRYAATACLLAAALAMPSSEPTAPAAAVPPVRHVFVIVLENASFEQSYGPDSRYPALSVTARGQGTLLDQYYAVAHYSAGNYQAILAGVAPGSDTQNDCPRYRDMTGAARAAFGQVKASSGCIYPSWVPTLASQLTAKQLSWKGYMEDMANQGAREQSTCGQPALGPHNEDLTQKAVNGDAYAARHNPFVYFRSVTSIPACAANVVPLTDLPQDLATIGHTPNFSFITPNLCDDGHDSTCNGKPSDPSAENSWLQTWIPRITSSPAFRADGALFITSDEADNDSGACCQEPSGPNTAYPGYPKSAGTDVSFTGSQGSGKGGGRIGTLVISPFVRPGGTSSTPYNHYSLLRSIEDLFGLTHLGYAGQPGLQGFGTDLWSVGAGISAPPGPCAAADRPAPATPCRPPER